MKYFKSTFSWLAIWTVAWILFWMAFGIFILPGAHNPFLGAFIPFIMPFIMIFSDGYGGSFQETILPMLIYWGVFGGIIFYKKKARKLD